MALRLGRGPAAGARGARAAARAVPAAVSIAPMGDRVLVKAEPLAEKTAGGLLLPTSAVETESVLFGEVLDVGDECSEAGVAKGSHIVFTEYAATQVDAADGEVCFVRGDDILAVLS